jgi:hypothetical protein
MASSHFPWPSQLLAVSVDNHPMSRSRRKPHAESRDGTIGLSQPNIHHQSRLRQAAFSFDASRDLIAPGLRPVETLARNIGVKEAWATQ